LTYIFGYLFPKGADGKPDRAAIGAVLPAMQTQIDVLNKAVAGTDYLGRRRLLSRRHLPDARSRGFSARP
jgi:hypothetical protein